MAAIWSVIKKQIELIKVLDSAQNFRIDEEVQYVNFIKKKYWIKKLWQKKIRDTLNSYTFVNVWGKNVIIDKIRGFQKPPFEKWKNSKFMEPELYPAT